MENNLDILFLAGLFPKEKEKEILENSKGAIQNAANNLQWSIVEGLDANLVYKPKILNSYYVGSFPKRYKKIKIDTFEFSHSKGSNDINIGFINLSGIKHVSRYLTLKPQVKRWISQKSDRKKVVIAYAMTMPFTRILRYVKSLDENIVTCLIVPDLPQFMNTTKSNNNALYNLLKNYEMDLLNKDLHYIDSYVLLTKHMREALKITVPSAVVEGISTKTSGDSSYSEKVQNRKTVLYSGLLMERYGVLNLLSSFERLNNPNYELIICGTGELEDEFIEASKRDNRIIFKGQLPREEVLDLQKASSILINPRPNNEEYTKYSFPSKILEYMSSGTPVISYELDGIPEEYYGYMYSVDDYEDSLFDVLKETLEKSERELYTKGFLAKQFVLEEKNSYKQAKKIVEMLKSIKT
ncbi:glycosyltransferase [Sporosarcina ureae]|uniref:glycosyltransferase n=1 Tax=Sporosarcina ureae TaxID=1571 RepID=UPI0026EE0540|nr:glycosyltransferase [Sporosarcina ureae]